MKTRKGALQLSRKRAFQTEKPGSEVLSQGHVWQVQKIVNFNGAAAESKGYILGNM